MDRPSNLVNICSHIVNTSDFFRLLQKFVTMHVDGCTLAALCSRSMWQHDGSARSMTVCPCASDAAWVSFVSATSGEWICRFLIQDLLGHSVAEMKHLVSLSTSGISRFRIQLLMSGRVLSEEEIPFADESCYSSSVHIVFLFTSCVHCIAGIRSGCYIAAIKRRGSNTHDGIAS